MDNAVLQIRISKKLKNDSMVLAQNLGFSTSTLIKLFLAHVVDKRKIPFEIEEIPNAKTAKIILQAEKDIESGNTNDWYSFDDMDDAVNFLKKSIKSKNRYAGKTKTIIQTKTRDRSISSSKTSIPAVAIV